MGIRSPRGIATLLGALFTIMSGVLYGIHFVLDQTSRVQAAVAIIGEAQKPNAADRLVDWLTKGPSWLPLAVFGAFLVATLFLGFGPRDWRGWRFWEQPHDVGKSEDEQRTPNEAETEGIIQTQRTRIEALGRERDGLKLELAAAKSMSQPADEWQRIQWPQAIALPGATELSVGKDKPVQMFQITPGNFQEVSWGGVKMRLEYVDQYRKDSDLAVLLKITGKHGLLPSFVIHGGPAVDEVSQDHFRLPASGADAGARSTYYHHYAPGRYTVLALHVDHLNSQNGLLRLNGLFASWSEDLGDLFGKLFSPPPPKPGPSPGGLGGPGLGGPGLGPQDAT